MEDKPMIDDTLYLGKECLAMLRTKFLPYDVHDSTTCISDLTLGHLSTKDFSILYQNIFVSYACPIVSLSIFIVSHVLDLWNHETEDLLSAPKRNWFENSRLRNSFSIINPHHELHQIFIVDESVSLCQEHATQEWVLHNTHDWLVWLWVHHLLWHKHHLFDFCYRLVALRNVHVHFVTVKVSVVWWGYTQVHSKRGVREDLDSMAHDGHLVQWRLSVEHDIVTIFDMPFDFVSNFDVSIWSILESWEVDLSIIVSDDEFGSRPILRTILDEFLHFIIIIWSHSFWICQIGRNI